MDTPEIEARIIKAAVAIFDDGRDRDRDPNPDEPDDNAFAPTDVFFEHGHWWLRYTQDGRCDADNDYVQWFEDTFGSDADEVTYAVVDATGTETADGFGFEKV